MNHINSVGANAASIILSICNSYQISKYSHLTELRFSSNQNDKTTKKHQNLFSWYKRIYRSIKFILSILGVKEITMILITITALVLRSLFHLRLLYVSTRIENSVILKNENSFWKSLSDFGLYIIPTSLLFATYNYCLSELAIHIRTNTSEALIKKFTTNNVYYQVINSNQIQSILNTDHSNSNKEDSNHNVTITTNTNIATDIDMNNIKSFANPDQILTNDIEHFSYALTGLFSHVLRPIVDILVNAERLYVTSGALIPTVMSIYLIVSSSFLNYLRIPITEYTDSEQNLEGEYRSLIAKLSNSAEEIASLNGGVNEHVNITTSLYSLINYSRRFAQFRCNMSFLDSMVARYWLMMIGWRIVGQHFFHSFDNSTTTSSSSSLQSSNEELYSNYQNMSKTMVALSNAIGQLIMSGKDIVKVFAYSEKLAEFEEMMRMLISKHEENEIMNRNNNCSKDINNCCLSLENVTIYIPNSTSILHSELNITFERGMHTVITGENGSGKSSLLRVLGGLWPISKGIVIRPIFSKYPLLYLPQKPYMPYGSLRQQIVYPDVVADNSKDHLLIQLLHQVQLGYLLHPTIEINNLSYTLANTDSSSRNSGNTCGSAKSYDLDTLLDWNEVLSGGEKQRLSLARVLYHKPIFALLDECTSAVSSEIELVLYEVCMRELSHITTFISISHRPQLKQFHKYELALTRENTHNFTRIPTLEIRNIDKPEISGEI